MLLVIPTTAYSEKVWAMVGSKIIDRAMEMIKKVELVRATTAWKQAHFGAVMSRSLQLPCRSMEDRDARKGATPPPFPTYWT